MNTELLVCSSENYARGANKTFVKEDKVDGKYSKMIRTAFENRMESDYNVVADFTKEDVNQSFEDMQTTIIEIQNLLEQTTI